MAEQSLDRELLWQFAVSVFPQASNLTALQGDAGLRRYYRLQTGSAERSTAILVDSRADAAACARFCRLSALFAAAAVPVPQIYAVNSSGDVLLIEDLGDVCLDKALTEQAAQKMPELLVLLSDWQHKTRHLQADLPPYSAAILREELSRLEKWFFPHFLGKALNAHETAAFEQDAQSLLNMILAQPQAAVHRDFHCRNLMQAADGRVVIIDYQDALWGAATYDLVSLTRDCYVKYDHAQRLAWEEDFRSAHYPQISRADWQKACHAQSLQRHLKILGLFVRLALQENKPRYLAYLPQVWADVQWESAALAAELPFMAELIARLQAAVAAQFVARGL